MALGTVTLATLRADLRSRLGELTPVQLSDEELNRWLNVGQKDVAVRLYDISDTWYLSSESGTFTSGSYTLTATDVHKVKAVMKTSDRKLLPIVPVSELGGYSASSFWGTSTEVVAQVGKSLVSSNSLSTTGITIYYHRTPADMSTDSSPMDVPDEFQDLVILFAQARAYQKLGMLDKELSVRRSVSERLNEIRNTYVSEFQIDAIQRQQGESV